ncbi:MAG: hypothetical protein JJ953_07465 [Gracilimonas sp.]|uniref:DUF6428 family protein n=1 Tax=Gracilimonas TaxID=649462 RepID=UPI001B0366F1|nr:DUF6428 family protein [Gracilimonas sp.]MBO6585922.1 hypothetical protein [Gracilimonas sp.]MBO6616919.1 hypothetical protein [Gracilimonas sp.]
MNTSTFVTTLVNNTGKELQFSLPDSTVISGDLHITEIQHHSIDSVDCGGNEHSYNETVIQLWVNENSENTAEWTTDKALKIIELVGEKQAYRDEAELFIEFGDSKHPTIRYSIQDVKENSETLIMALSVKPTVCKPSLNREVKAGACC